MDWVIAESHSVRLDAISEAQFVDAVKTLLISRFCAQSFESEVNVFATCDRLLILSLRYPLSRELDTHEAHL
jgi:hypothetical protein